MSTALFFVRIGEYTNVHQILSAINWYESSLPAVIRRVIGWLLLLLGSSSPSLPPDGCSVRRGAPRRGKSG